MLSESILWWGLAAILFFWSVGAYNRLMRLRSLAFRAFSALAIWLQRYPELVEACGQIAELQGQAWSGVQGAQAQFSASLAIARVRPLDAAAVDALAAADHVLQMAWMRAVEVGHSPAAMPPPELICQQWKEVGRQVHHASNDFAQAVQDYNTAITQFPAVLLALLFGFRTAKPLYPLAPSVSFLP